MPFGKGSSKKKKHKTKPKGDRDRDFTAEPEGGWLHDQQALAFGGGVFYTFPVRYIGSIQVMKSLRTLTGDGKTDMCREAINRCAEGAKKFKVKRKQLPVYKEFLADLPFLKEMDLKLNISGKNIATTDLGNGEIIAMDDMGKISFAAGGTDKTYDWITYVAKDKRGNRYCHVFDCGKVADDILATLGQVFTITSNPPPLPSSQRPGAKPPLPTNHPSQASGGQLMGAAALAAAPKLAGVPQVSPQLTYDDGETYDAIDNPGPTAADHTYGDMEPAGAMNPLMKGSAPPPPPGAGNAGLQSYEDMEGTNIPQYGEMVALGGAPPVAAGAIDMYEQLEGPLQSGPSGAKLVEFLNQQAASRNIYGDDSDDENLYGDGEIGWSYLDVKPELEDTYGTLADFAGVS
eukprot:TRINITY_DN11917_c0_g1_i2.p1 TRINITY_DN11917_c0_g1~~TRINITY_DN11917_c0_g1_i2.p1  ORF type:complete len:403 (+),score=83.24 TRINITY_DN11917_c0_g1_i2:70-1278(+)